MYLLNSKDYILLLLWYILGINDIVELNWLIPYKLNTKLNINYILNIYDT